MICWSPRDLWSNGAGALNLVCALQCAHPPHFGGFSVHRRGILAEVVSFRVAEESRSWLCGVTPHTVESEGLLRVRLSAAFTSMLLKTLF